VLAPVFQFVVEEARDGSSGRGGDGRLALRVGRGHVGLRTWRSGGTRMCVVSYHCRFLRIRCRRNINVGILAILLTVNWHLGASQP
jgi:hypothetical protein